MEIKRIFFYFLIVTLSTSCVSEITLAKINKPSNVFFRENIKRLKIWNKQFIENDPQIIKKVVDEEVYYFNRKISIRNKIIDSLKLLKKDKLIIIDTSTDSNGNRIESSYFFYDDKTIFAGFLRKDSIINGRVFVNFVPDIKIKTKEYIVKNAYYVSHIFDIFNSHKIPYRLDSGSVQTSYLITVVDNKNINYYSIKGVDNNKIVKR